MDKLDALDKLDASYVRLLHVGFTVLRCAIESRDDAWIAAEIELLHNVPSLICESRIGRHEYFWTQERVRYIEWMSANGSGWAQSRMRTYYEPIWAEMGEIIVRRISASNLGIADD